MKNKFDGFIGLAKQQENSKIIKSKDEKLFNQEDSESEQMALPQPKRGRPSGKRSDQGFKQVTAYINIETYKRTKIRLFEEDNKQEFSELVDSLLQIWLNEKSTC